MSSLMSRRRTGRGQSKTDGRGDRRWHIDDATCSPVMICTANGRRGPQGGRGQHSRAGAARTPRGLIAQWRMRAIHEGGSAVAPAGTDRVRSRVDDGPTTDGRGSATRQTEGHGDGSLQDDYIGTFKVRQY